MDNAKRVAAKIASDWVQKLIEDPPFGDPPFRLGLGSGSTADEFIRLLGKFPKRLRRDLVCVATSERTSRAAKRAGLGLAEFTSLECGLDACVDGADEIDPQLNLIKGGGGALFREKIVAEYSSLFVVIADSSKCVEVLGQHPLPVEVVPFGLNATWEDVEFELDLLNYVVDEDTIRLRGEDGPFVTENGNCVLDLRLRRIGDPYELDEALSGITGVVTSGLFLGLVDYCMTVGPNGTAEVRSAVGTTVAEDDVKELAASAAENSQSNGADP